MSGIEGFFVLTLFDVELKNMLSSGGYKHCFKKSNSSFFQEIENYSQKNKLVCQLKLTIGKTMLK